MKELQCLQCSYSWTPRTASPRACPNCKSRFWNSEEGPNPVGRPKKFRLPTGRPTHPIAESLPSQLPDFPEFTMPEAPQPPVHEDTPVEELVENPPFTALEGEK